MDAASLIAFRLQAQLSLEATYPATITLPGGSPIVCAGGSIRQTGQSFVPGGLIGEYDLAFRVRTSLAGALPEVGTLLTFAGKKWKIMRAAAPQSDCVYYLGCDNPGKQ